MTHTELKQVILDYMKECQGVLFIGNIQIEDLEPIGYKVSINLDNSENPIIIMADLPDDKFVPFILEELRSRKLHRLEHFKLEKLCPRRI